MLKAYMIALINYARKYKSRLAYTIDVSLHQSYYLVFSTMDEISQCIKIKICFLINWKTILIMSA
jgi:hypothetical protein